ncbi:Cysteine--tRNA ligase [Entomobacter blattae]|uniref:Cysteine--tRNA ligase n=1 Tax=Entomobacter blattae TaxID=2762277 RepID=A0A7H1NSB4_9PROT|nr:Cysteine--tRNA ligase [Entomobacter blattae]
MSALPQLFLYNSHKRSSRMFVPLDKENVRVYYCGPTVYDLIHIGNLRALLTADILVRLLRILYPHVTYVRNITDVDDKINERARLNHEPIEALTARTIIDFHKDTEIMGIARPDIEPRATQNIPEMQQIIATLITNGHAYVAEGHVLFSVGDFKDYGALSGRKQEELIAGARVEVASYKHHPGDFVLWKPSEEGLPGWDSPWGRGRPGWHIECSAMSHRFLGADFDIHGGGDDLLFPHHENERAQSLCCFPGSHFAHYWVHNAMLLVEGEKMSKSLGNFYTVREVVAEHPPEALRLHILQAHYRSVTNFSFKGLKEARQTLDRFYRAIEPFEGDDKGEESKEGYSEAFLQALCDDLNTPRAIAELHTLADRALAGNAQAASQLKGSGKIIGLMTHTAEAWFRSGIKVEAAFIQQKIEERLQAKREKNFALADSIRQSLSEQGILLEDTPSGTEWRIK